MRFSRNRKTLVGGAIVLTDAVYILTIYGTMDRIPKSIEALHVVVFLLGMFLVAFGVREDRKTLRPVLSRTAADKN